MADPRRRWWNFWLLQAVICYAVYNAFEFVRSQIEGSRADSVIHGRYIISTERFLHIFKQGGSSAEACREARSLAGT